MGTVGYSLCLEGTPDLCVVGTGAAGSCAITLVSTGQGRGGSRFRGDTGGRVFPLWVKELASELDLENSTSSYVCAARMIPGYRKGWSAFLMVGKAPGRHPGKGKMGQIVTRGVETVSGKPQPTFLNKGMTWLNEGLGSSFYF